MTLPVHHELFRSILERHRSFVLTTHLNADGDALGSEIGLARFLLSRGYGVTIVNQDPVPENLAFLTDERIEFRVFDPERDAAYLQEAERIILLDNSAPDRLGRLEPVMLECAQRTLCIDHHPARKTPWADNILDQEASATAELVYRLTVEEGWKPDARAAEALYVGLATDTGFFRFNSTNAAAHAFAAELLEIGVDPARCYRETYERNSPAYTRLLGAALESLRLDAGGEVVSARITAGMMNDYEAEGVDTSEMTTPLLAIGGVRIALLFRELPGGKVKVSLRSKGDLDVHRLAAEFGGGGHRNASGIVTDGVLEEVTEMVIRRASELVRG
jgi:phosphoesterase RecJ-like protein